MYVERRPVQDLPKGVKILTEDEVVEYYDNHIFGTTHTKDVWYLKHGFIIAGCTAFLTNFSLADYYRRRCKIFGAYSVLAMNLAFVAVPSTCALCYHYLECRRRILLQNLCTSCLFGRGALAQNVFGVLYALGPTAFGCLVIAGLTERYPIPGFSGINAIKGTYEVWKKFTKRRIPHLCIYIIANTAIVTYLIHMELEDKDRLDEILKKQHEKLRTVAKQYEEKK